jgi:hypothetical protein
MPTYISPFLQIKLNLKDINGLKTNRKPKIDKDGNPGPNTDTNANEPVTYARDIEEDEKSEETAINNDLTRGFGTEMEQKFLHPDERDEIKTINLIGAVSLRNTKRMALAELYLDDLKSSLLKLTLGQNNVIIVSANKRVRVGTLDEFILEALALPRERKFLVKASKPSFKQLMKLISLSAEDGDLDSVKDIIFKYLDQKVKIYIRMDIDNQREVKDVKDSEKPQDETSMFQKGNPAGTDYNNYMDTYCYDPATTMMQMNGVPSF